MCFFASFFWPDFFKHKAPEAGRPQAGAGAPQPQPKLLRQAGPLGRCGPPGRPTGLRFVLNATKPLIPHNPACESAPCQPKALNPIQKAFPVYRPNFFLQFFLSGLVNRQPNEVTPLLSTHPQLIAHARIHAHPQAPQTEVQKTPTGCLQGKQAYLSPLPDFVLTLLGRKQ